MARKSLFLLISFTIVLSIKGESDLNDKSISKCCPEQYYMSDNTCVRYDITTKVPDFSELDIYDNSLTKVNETVKDLFRIVYGNMHNQTVEADIFNTYLVNDGNLNIEIALPNTYHRVTKVRSGLFCVDYIMPENGTVPELRFWYTQEEKQTMDTAFVIGALSVSVIILTLTLLVFMVLNESKSLYARILMAMISCLLGASGMITVQLIVTSSGYDYSSEFCLTFTFCIYFFTLSSFCWMNVVGCHLWRKIKSERKSAVKADRSLLYYCCFGWGVPLLMSTALIAINESDLSDVPWFIKPNILMYGCFLSGYEKFFYLYVPLLVLLISNWIVLLITGYELKQLQPLKEMYAGIQRKRFFKYLQLTLVMSLLWVLAVICFDIDDLTTWYIAETVYMLLCLAIFLILCCNRRSITSFKNRISRNRNEETYRGCHKELHPLAGPEPLPK